MYYVLLPHFCFAVTDLVEQFSFLSALRSMHSFLTFTGQIIFSLLCHAVLCMHESTRDPVGFSYIPSHTKTIFTQDWKGLIVQEFGVSSTEKRPVLEWYFAVWEFSNICVLSGKMSVAFSASLGLHWQIWFHCDWYWLQLLMLWLVYILFTQQLIMDKHDESQWVYNSIHAMCLIN